MIDTNNILEILAKETQRIPPGIYLAHVLEVELRAAKFRDVPYFAVKLEIKHSPTIFAMVGGVTKYTFPLLEFFMPKLVGETVKVQIKRVEYGERTFLDARILEVTEYVQSCNL